MQFHLMFEFNEHYNLPSNSANQELTKKSQNAKTHPRYHYPL